MFFKCTNLTALTISR
ncbi:MAG TPA: hypothetical protein DCP65_10465 [Acinetobacter nosocomialis]|nr:hypothetical protein [Acinetobacter nosocomialis]